MVGGAHHHDDGHQRVDDPRRPRQARAAVLPQDHPAPQRPAHVQARHRGVLVGHAAQAARRARLAAPPAVVAVLRHRVDEPVGGRQQPGRARRQQREADQTDERRGQQPGAGRAVAHGAEPEHPYEQDRRDQVVQRRVPEVGRYAEPGLAGEEAVERVLRVQAQELLDAQDRQAVVDGGGDVPAREQTARGVGAVHQEDQRQLRPPAQPGAVRRLLGAWCIGLRHPIALPLLLSWPDGPGQSMCCPVSLMGRLGRDRREDRPVGCRERE